MTGAYDWQLVLYHALHAPRHPHAELSRGEYACAQRPKEGPCLGTSVTRPKLRRPPSTPPLEAPHRSPVAREQRRQHRATVENEAHAWCCARVDRPVLVAARLRSNVRDRSPRAGSPFRELGQFQRQLEQFQRDFDEVFDQCLQARWRSAMRPRALPVAHRRRPSRYPCRPALGRSERHPNGRRRPSSI
jgi:hypothetical protein